MLMKSCYALLLLLSLPASGAWSASTFDSAIERAAREQLNRYAESIGWVEPQLKLKFTTANLGGCPSDPRIETIDVRQPSRMRFAALCNGEKREVVVRATIAADVVVATEELKAGQPIDASALKRERRDVTNTPGAIAGIEDVAGKTSRRVLKAGQVVDRRWLNDSVLVKRNSKVTIVARNAGVEVHVAAEALQAGKRGEVISVKNSANGTVIRARVIAQDTVEPVEAR
ncbi:flagellar basal body P-ring formation chaperone FlgA [Steroidobacter sp.]|uniref:flagellar basal body P-ring formation chaperone FlgA n=1 Tax=Steroidobacter sp. TaxID=1978227 RepID=UPI001A63E76A|nr:flagellar basal body P-ring formation chaperone FlgA [Steroidobacter sp.]MBL8265482.1 flagellar basal body P-ring formation protein FlgA [Steroidobacter sp.]